MKHVVSFSGGRTSAYLVWLVVVELVLKGVSSKDIFVIFMDTGAEHPKTYEFIKTLVKRWRIDLVCLRVVINHTLGKGNSYRVISLNELKQDLEPWEEMTEKYGTPYIGGEFCTDRMKTTPYKKYCDDTFGKGNYTTWLGMRFDEPKRLVGDHIVYARSIYKQLIKQGLDDYGISELFCKASENLAVIDGEYGHLDPKTREMLTDRINLHHKVNFRYLAQISEIEKPEILEWWTKQPFDLGIEEHLGNCVFCIKKSINKVALATKDERFDAIRFHYMLSREDVRILKTRTSNHLMMYRDNNTLMQVISFYQDIPRADIASTIRGRKQYDSGSCSESCEVFNDDQLDLFKEI